jgi:sugar phosphate isomerase/epimerase
MKLGCQEHLIPGDDLVEKWRFVSSAGFDAIELHGHGDFGLRARRDELRAAQGAGAVLSTACVIMDHFIGDFDAARRRDAIDNVRSMLSVMGELGGFGVITPAAYGLFSRRLPPYDPPRSAAEDRAVLLEGLAELGEHARSEGVVLLLEPLNRYEDHMVNTLGEAADLCDATGLGSVRVMGDVFHMNIEEDDLGGSIRAERSRLAHIHLGDSNRAHPGTGHLDFASVFAALDDIGFDGTMALECGIRGDARAVLPQVARFLRARMSKRIER